MSEVHGVFSNRNLPSTSLVAFRVPPKALPVACMFVQGDKYGPVFIPLLEDIQFSQHHMGKCLLNELQGSEICVDYAIDKRPENAEDLIKVYLPDEDLPTVDAVVVTAFYYFDEIEEMLSEKVEYPVISLEDILYEV